MAAGGALTLAFVHNDQAQQQSANVIQSADDAEDSLGHGHDRRTIEMAERTPGGRATTTINGFNGRANGSSNGGAAQLSPGPSRDHTPINTTRKGMYSKVGDETDAGGVEISARTEFVRGSSGGTRETYHSLALGRAGEVEGQMEAGGARWDGESDSDSDGDAGRASELVEPAVGATRIQPI